MRKVGNKGQDDNALVERIYWGDTCLTYIIRASFLPDKTTFLTPPDCKQQVGYIVYPAGGEIQRHVHRPMEQHLVGTSEVVDHAGISTFTLENIQARNGVTLEYVEAQSSSGNFVAADMTITAPVIDFSK